MGKTEFNGFGNAVVLITGGSSGIGRATARSFAAAGAHVWLLARDPDKLESALAEVQRARPSTSQRCGYVVADVVNWEQTAAAIEQVIDTVGSPDVVINSAGAAHPGYVQTLNLDVFRWMMEVNYLGTVHVVKSILPSLLARQSGHIVNVGSLGGIIAINGLSAYAASKFAVRGFSDVLRAELTPRGIGVSLVLPADVDTPGFAYENRFKPWETKVLSSNGGLLRPETVAESILRGVRRGNYLIFPDRGSHILYWISSLVGRFQYPVLDWLVARARRNRPVP